LEYSVKIQDYAQTTFETCLAVCLWQFTGDEINQEKELEVMDYALKFSRDHFTVNHLDYFAKNFDLKINLYLDNKFFLDYTKKANFSEKITLIQEKINQKLIDTLISEKPLILYIDSFVFWKVTHYPHFIIVLEKQGNNYKIYDPWEGKTTLMPIEKILAGVTSLKEHLLFCPQLIKVF